MFVVTLYLFPASSMSYCHGLTSTDLREVNAHTSNTPRAGRVHRSLFRAPPRRNMSMRMYNALARSRTPARPRGAPETDPQRVIHTHPQPYKVENATSRRFRTHSIDVSPPPAPPATASPPPCRRIGNTLRPQHLLSCMRAAAGCSPSCARAGWQRCCCCCCCHSSGLEPPSQ